MALRVALLRDTIRKDGKLVPRVVQRCKVDFDELLGYMDFHLALVRWRSPGSLLTRQWNS